MDDRRLIGGWRERRVRQHRADHPVIEYAGAFPATSLRAMHDLLLVGEQIAGGEPRDRSDQGAMWTSARTRKAAAARSTVTARAPCPWAAAQAMTASRRANVFCLSVSPAAPASSALTRSASGASGALTGPRRSASSSRSPRPCSAARARTTSRHGAVSTRSASARACRERSPHVHDHLTSTPAAASSRSRSTISRRRVENSRKHRRSNLLDLGHPVAHRPPAHPRQPLHHRRAEVRLVEVAGRLGVLVDRRRVQRRPATIRAARHVCRDHMRMELRILRAAHPMPIRRRHQPLPHLAPRPTAATTHTTRLPLQIPQRRVDRRLMRLDHRARRAPVPPRQTTRSPTSVPRRSGQTLPPSSARPDA